MNKVNITKDCENFVKDRWVLKFSMKTFKEAKQEYLNIKAFNPDDNIWETSQTITDEAHYFMRLSTQYYLTEAFKAMKIDMNNDNVKEHIESGNIGTPGRIAKVYVGSAIDDTSELVCGRWNKPPRIATFPNDTTIKIPITKRVDIISNCSHHGIVFDSLSRSDSYAFISYIPGDVVLGISKLQKYANFISSRLFLQEDLTRKLWEGVVKIAGTEDVFIKLVNIVHGCESKRSVKSKDGAFSSEYYGGLFKDPVLRAQVEHSV